MLALWRSSGENEVILDEELPLGEKKRRLRPRTHPTPDPVNPKAHKPYKPYKPYVYSISPVNPINLMNSINYKPYKPYKPYINSC